MTMLFENGFADNRQDETDVTGATEKGIRKKVRWKVKESQNQIIAEPFNLTPADAEALFERNADDEYKNRPAGQATIKKFARAMDRGWKFTGEPLIISRSGRLLNGQHRLRACIESGCSFPVLIVFGIDDDAFAYMDQGRKRGAGDIFHICGVPKANNMAAAARWVWRYHKHGMNKPRHDQAPENDELYDYYLTLTGLQASHKFGDNFSRYKLASKGLMTALHYLCAQKSRREADDFFERVSTGIGLQSKNEPAAKLREALIENKAGADRYPDEHIGAFVVMAWNAQRQNKPIKLFRWRTKQEPNKPFPRIV
jgi:hypothetical protein